MPQRETFEFRPVTVKDSTGTAYTGAWSYQIAEFGSRPTGSWVAAATHASRKGIAVQSLTAGLYWVWFRIDDDDPYIPVPDPALLHIH